MSSKHLIAYYRSAAHWYWGLCKATSCYRASRIGVEYTLDEQEKLREARRSLERAKALFTEIYSARIGAAVTGETSSAAS